MNSIWKYPKTNCFVKADLIDYYRIGLYESSRSGWHGGLSKELLYECRLIPGYHRTENHLLNLGREKLIRKWDKENHIRSGSHIYIASNMISNFNVNSISVVCPSKVLSVY